MNRPGAVLLAALALAAPAAAEDGRTDVSLSVSWRRSSELDAGEAGVGGRLSLRVRPWLALDATGSYFPSDLGAPGPRFSGSRIEGLAGVRVGPGHGRARPYAALRGGVLRFGKAPEPFPCILIYPPPLTCSLAGGQTLPTAFVGAGLEAHRGARLLLGVEVGDQLVRYDGPAFDADREIFDRHRWSHDLRVNALIGVRF